MKEENFYTVYSYSDRLKPGREITIGHSVSLSDQKADISKLTALPTAELIKLKSESEQKESNIFDKLVGATAEWEQQAAETARINQAIEYVLTPAVEHTNNQWMKHDYDLFELSNMVYKMTYRIYENTKYNRTLKVSETIAWELTWSVWLNTPLKQNYYQSTKIAGQDRKLFPDKASMEKYLQGRKDAYAYLFTEISPSIPNEHKEAFFVNGQLLPGYTVQPSQEATVSALLNLLDDNEIDQFLSPEEAAPETKPKEAASKNTADKAKKSRPKGQPTR